MNSKAKIEQLKKTINESLSPLIDRDYYLLELPYYTNIGDTLIWQGEMDFLKHFPFKCKGMYSLETFPNCKIEDGSLILFQGGGNFGDLWAKHHDFKMDIIRKYPNNKFVFFPQTVYFQNKENLKACAEFLSKHEHITICARDAKSYKILIDNFCNNILLVPDMAFYMNIDKWRIPNYGSKDLLLKRIDTEFKDSAYIQELSLKENIDITDWPTMWPLDKETRRMLRFRDSHKIPKVFADKYVYFIYRPHLIKTGVNLLAGHSKIYSTRLHTAILGLMMDKEIEFINNSYGKNKTFYDTWLQDCDNITFIES